MSCPVAMCLAVACVEEEEEEASSALFGGDSQDSSISDWPLVPITPDLTEMDSETSAGDRLPAFFFGSDSNDFTDFSWSCM